MYRETNHSKMPLVEYDWIKMIHPLLQRFRAELLLRYWLQLIYVVGAEYKVSEIGQKKGAGGGRRRQSALFTS
jgi:hypothetical protein